MITTTEGSWACSWPGNVGFFCITLSSLKAYYILSPILGVGDTKQNRIEIRITGQGQLCTSKDIGMNVRKERSASVTTEVQGTERGPAWLKHGGHGEAGGMGLGVGPRLDSTGRHWAIRRL